MMIISGIGNVLVTIFKWVMKLLLGMLGLVLELAKLFLLLFGLVARVVLAFVGAAVP